MDQKEFGSAMGILHSGFDSEDIDKLFAFYDNGDGLDYHEFIRMMAFQTEEEKKEKKEKEEAGTKDATDATATDSCSDKEKDTEKENETDTEKESKSERKSSRSSRRSRGGRSGRNGGAGGSDSESNASASDHESDAAGLSRSNSRAALDGQRQKQQEDGNIEEQDETSPREDKDEDKDQEKGRDVNLGKEGLADKSSRHHADPSEGIAAEAAAENDKENDKEEEEEKEEHISTKDLAKIASCVKELHDLLLDSSTDTDPDTDKSTGTVVEKAEKTELERRDRARDRFLAVCRGIDEQSSLAPVLERGETAGTAGTEGSSSSHPERALSGMLELDQFLQAIEALVPASRLRVLAKGSLEAVFKNYQEVCPSALLSDHNDTTNNGTSGSGDGNNNQGGGDGSLTNRSNRSNRSLNNSPRGGVGEYDVRLNYEDFVCALGLARTTEELLSEVREVLSNLLKSAPSECERKLEQFFSKNVGGGDSIASLGSSRQSARLEAYAIGSSSLASMGQIQVPSANRAVQQHDQEEFSEFSVYVRNMGALLSQAEIKQLYQGTYYIHILTPVHTHSYTLIRRHIQILTHALIHYIYTCTYTYSFPSQQTSQRSSYSPQSQPRGRTIQTGTQR